MLKTIIFSGIISMTVPAFALDSQLHCLAINIAKEARNQPKKGKIAVGYVTINRAKAKFKGKFKSNLCRIVYEKNQFSWTGKKQKTYPSNADYKEALIIASNIINGTIKDNTNKSTHFHTHKTSPKWSRGKRPIKIGDHLFYNNMVSR